MCWSKKRQSANRRHIYINRPKDRHDGRLPSQAADACYRGRELFFYFGSQVFEKMQPFYCGLVLTREAASNQILGGRMGKFIEKVGVVNQ